MNERCTRYTPENCTDQELADRVEERRRFQVGCGFNEREVIELEYWPYSAQQIMRTRERMSRALSATAITPEYNVEFLDRPLCDGSLEWNH